jgi:hypothetical protein
MRSPDPSSGAQGEAPGTGAGGVVVTGAAVVVEESRVAPTSVLPVTVSSAAKGGTELFAPSEGSVVPVAFPAGALVAAALESIGSALESAEGLLPVDPDPVVTFLVFGETESGVVSRNL